MDEGREGEGKRNNGKTARQIGQRVMKWKRVIIGQRQKYCT